MEQNETRNSLTIADLWDIFVSHIWPIIIVGLLAFAIVLGYWVVSYQAEYTSSATVYILRQNNDTAGTATTPSNSDFSLALSTVNDCTLLLTSRNVLDKVINELGMNINFNKLQKMVSISNPENSRMLTIRVTAPTPADAKIIVDKLCEIGRAGIMDTLGIDQVNQVDLGTYSEVPSNSQFTPYSVIAGLAGALLVYGIYLLMFIFDDKIGTPDDVEKYLGLSVLGLIPNADAAADKKYGNDYRSNRSDGYVRSAGK